MKQRTQKYLHAILALVLSLCLITGCSLFPNSAPKADKNTSQETIAEEATETLLTTPPVSQTKQPWRSREAL